VTASHAERAVAAMARGRSRLLELQDPAGYWRSGRTAQIWLTASDLLFREFTGTASAEVTSATARWIRSMQRPDGGWPGEDGGRPAVSASVLAYWALRLAGDSADAYHMALAAGWIRDAGGTAAADFLTRVWLAIFGQVAWAELPVSPPEAIFLPAAYQLLSPECASLGRAAQVTLSVIAALRPVRRLPFGLAELQVPGALNGGQAEPPRVTGHVGLDRGLSAYERHAAEFAPLGAARSAAVRRCAEWIAGAQQPDGSWLAGELAQHFNLVALWLAGYPMDHPCLARGVAAVEAMVVQRPSPAGPLRWLEVGGPAVAATALAICGLADAGLPADHGAMLAAGEWMLAGALAAVARSSPRRSLGDLRTAATRQLADLHAPAVGGLQDEPSAGLAAAGHGMRRAAGDGSGARVADIAAAVVALRRVSLPVSSGQRPGTVCLVRWLAGVQRGDGGWGRRLLGAEQPAGARTAGWPATWQSASSVLLTARALAALTAAGQPGSSAIRRAGTWLLRQQLPDGSWPGERGTGELRATCAALLALRGAGVLAAKAPVTRATGWLLQRQNPDGGWGLIEHPGERPAGPSDPSAAAHTAQALLALLWAGGQGSAAAIERGAGWLLGAQLPEGSWPGPERSSPEGHDGGGRGTESAIATAWALSALAGLAVVGQAGRNEGQGRAGRNDGQLAGADLTG